jgi:hypothetical protein
MTLRFPEWCRVGPGGLVVLLCVFCLLSGCSSQTPPTGSDSNQQKSLIGSMPYNSGTRGFEAAWPYGPETDH